ncbi:hypothetical protein LEP1GSC150_2997 [Leptospira interrogans serovar Copenhageni str. LT2050]|uniref:Uncharacterized protein n=1 Tax=Leptospira interrogans serovar Copenhageni str. LT2050 TaxID=1001598 RepID=M3ISJ4_LEPIT|nr:hypothetical protein LEP1GSC150_2997 [Leptospira interrogans serovar Copenhageni str. LT2050]
MEELFSKLGYSGLFGIIWTSFLIRYLLFSGISFWVVWILFEKNFSINSFRVKNLQRKISFMKLSILLLLSLYLLCLEFL